MMLPQATIAPMTLDDIDAIMVLEKVCFSSPWPASGYRRELTGNALSHYWVVRPVAAGAALPPILAYGGYWLMDDEAHIVTLATHPEWRRHGLGEWLLLEMIARARAGGARSVTLEVRAGNAAALALYGKLGFIQVGRRRGYYQDNREDALLLSLEHLEVSNIWAALQGRKMALDARFAGGGQRGERQVASEGKVP